MRLPLAALLLALLLAGCAEPVFVPDAGPGAPGYSERPAPPPPDIKIVQAAKITSLPAGGVIDTVVREDGALRLTGWAHIDAGAPRGVLELVLPSGVDASVRESETVPRPDVIAATGNNELLWSGFSLTIAVSGSLPPSGGVCLLSRSKQGAFRLEGSDERLCPS